MNGIRLRRGDFVLHGAGEHLHQLVEASTRWGQISIRSADLVRFGRIPLQAKLTPPRQLQFLRVERRWEPTFCACIPIPAASPQPSPT